MLLQTAQIYNFFFFWCIIKPQRVPVFCPEPLKHPLLSGASSFTKHAALLISSLRDGLTSIGKEAAGKYVVYFSYMRT